MGARWLLLVALTALAATITGTGGAAQSVTDFTERLSDPAIQYPSRPSHDPVARLRQAVASGAVRLDESGPQAFLRSLLRALDVPETSQVMVFATSSLQRAIINPSNPRALYFGDSVSVGWVPGGIIEIAAQDPEQGVHFYAANPRVGIRSLAKRNDCLSCHHSYRTGEVPGMIEPLTHRRPLDARWAGWYVTGQLGPVRHLGNVNVNANPPEEPTERSFNWTSLRGRLDTSEYLSPYSDVAALLVFEHQMHLMNLLTKANWDARVAARSGEDQGAAAQVRESVASLVDYMLFVEEAPIASPILGSSGFADQFAKRGPFDRRGRSLRQLDLRTRLLKHPLSYMIYSEAFDRLPAQVRSVVFARLWAVLSGGDTSPKYRHLSPSDRSTILEILRDTKKDLPAAYAGTATP